MNKFIKIMFLLLFSFVFMQISAKAEIVKFVDVCAGTQDNPVEYFNNDDAQKNCPNVCNTVVQAGKQSRTDSGHKIIKQYYTVDHAVKLIFTGQWDNVKTCPGYKWMKGSVCSCAVAFNKK